MFSAFEVLENDFLNGLYPIIPINPTNYCELGFTTEQEKLFYFRPTIAFSKIV